MNLEIIPEATPDGQLYLNFFHGFAHHRVGPVVDREVLKVSLEEEAPAPVKGGVSRALKRASKKQEHAIAEDLGGRVQPGSGAVQGHKGDVRLRGRFRIEAKGTTAASYRVTRDDLEKIRSEATGKEKCAFVISFNNPRSLREADRWVLIPYEDWQAAYEAHFNK